VAAVMFWPSVAASVRRQAEGAPRRRLSWAGAIGALVGIACVAIGVGLTGGGAIGRASLLSQDFVTRIDALQLIVADVAAAPWAGYGLGSTALVFLHGVPSTLALAVWNFGAAHDAWLQAALEGGAPFVVLITLAAGAMIVPAVSALAANSSERALRISLIAALVVVAVCSLADIALNVPAVAAQAMVILGLLAGSARGRPSLPRAGRSSSLSQ
jgi:hypothetical protein